MGDRLQIVRIGIIGSGYMGRTFASVLRNIPEAKLIAIAGGRRAKGLASEFGVGFEDSWEKLVKREDIDAVIITSPHAFHAEQTILAVENGKHVLVEKPMAVSSKECEEMIRKAEEYGVKLMVAHSHRYWPANVYVKELLKKGTIGDIVMIRDAVIGGGLRKEDRLKRSWVADPKIAGGGALLFNGVHLIDRDRWWLEREVKKVYAQLGNWIEREISVEDTALVHLVFEDNIPGDICVSMAYSQGFTRAEIFGTKGILIVDTYKEVLLGKNGKWEIVYKVKDPVKERETTFTNEVRDFVKCIIEDKEPPIPGREGMINVKIVEAAYESAKTGKVIELNI